MQACEAAKPRMQTGILDARYPECYRDYSLIPFLEYAK